jgi:hypothetical protein
MLFDYVFDLLFDDGADLRPQPLSDRGARLKTYLADHGPGDAARIRLFHSKALDTDDSFSFTFAKSRNLRLFLRPASANAGRDPRPVAAPVRPGFVVGIVGRGHHRQAPSIPISEDAVQQLTQKPAQ